jgi:hypothetical protein
MSPPPPPLPALVRVTAAVAAADAAAAAACRGSTARRRWTARTTARVPRPLGTVGPRARARADPTPKRVREDGDDAKRRHDACGGALGVHYCDAMQLVPGEASHRLSTVHADRAGPTLLSRPTTHANAQPPTHPRTHTHARADQTACRRTCRACGTGGLETASAERCLRSRQSRGTSSPARTVAQQPSRRHVDNCASLVVG